MSPFVVQRVKYAPADRSWYDPQLLTYLTYQAYYDVSVPAESPLQLSLPNSQRLMIGFSVLGPTAEQPQVAPYPDPDVGGGWALVAGAPTWISIFDFGTLPTYGWWAFCTSSISIRVIEIRRSTGA